MEPTIEQRVKAAQEGDESAREFIALNCQGWIKARARSLAIPGYDYEDMIQAGIIGLLTAIETYDASVGVKFLTWAAPRIKTEMQDQYALQFPHTTPREIAAITRSHAWNRDKFLSENGREATDEEIVEMYVGTNRSEANLKQNRYKAQRALKARESQTVLRLDAEMATQPEDMNTLYEIVKDVNALDPIDYLVSVEEAPEKARVDTVKHEALVAACRENLNAQHCAVLLAAFGLEGPMLSDEEIGEIHGRDRVWANKVRYSAILRLRAKAPGLLEEINATIGQRDD